MAIAACTGGLTGGGRHRRRPVFSVPSAGAAFYIQQPAPPLRTRLVHVAAFSLRLDLFEFTVAADFGQVHAGRGRAGRGRDMKQSDTRVIG